MYSRHEAMNQWYFQVSYYFLWGRGSGIVDIFTVLVSRYRSDSNVYWNEKTFIVS